MITKNFVISYQKSRLLKFRFPFTSTTTAVLGKHFTELPGNMKQIALFTAFRSVYPCFNEVEGGILVSHCPSVRPSGSLALDRVVSALHLSQHYLDLIHIYICYPATSGVLCVDFSKFWFFVRCLLQDLAYHLLVSSQCDISGIDGPIEMERNGYKSIRYKIYYMTLISDPAHDFALGFSRSKFAITVFQEWMVRMI